MLDYYDRIICTVSIYHKFASFPKILLLTSLELCTNSSYIILNLTSLSPLTQTQWMHFKLGITLYTFIISTCKTREKLTKSLKQMWKYNMSWKFNYLINPIIGYSKQSTNKTTQYVITGYLSLIYFICSTVYK